MDPRQRRTTDRLHEAVLRLAAEHPVGELTVTQVAAAAGVHRSTFYEYADTPSDLLRAALLAELDEAREGLLDDPARPTQEAVDAVTRQVLEHVRAHADVYRRGLGPASGVAGLHAMLSEHFLGSSRLLLAQGRVDLHLDVPGLPTGAADDAALHFLAQGTVGVIEVWLGLAEDPDPALFEALYARLLPPWWRSL